MSLAQIINRRRQGLLALWDREPLVLVQVESSGALGQVQSLGDPANIVPGQALSRRDAGDVFYFPQPGDRDVYTSLWVRAGYSGYRQAYLAFVEAVYSYTPTAAEFSPYDADHLLNRARARVQDGFIRLEAVESAVNQAWGRLFEKNASNRNFYANRERVRRTMSWTIAAKLAGQMPPAGPSDTAGIQQLTNFFAQRPNIGMTPADIRSGLQDMLQFAYSNP
jgi:hypothetical protein